MYPKMAGSSKWGFVDRNGTWAIPPIYDYAEPFEEGISVAHSHDCRQVIDVHGNVLVRFSDCTPLNGHILLAEGESNGVDIYVVRNGWIEKTKDRLPTMLRSVPLEAYREFGINSFVAGTFVIEFEPTAGSLRFYEAGCTPVFRVDERYAAYEDCDRIRLWDLMSRSPFGPLFDGGTERSEGLMCVFIDEVGTRFLTRDLNNPFSRVFEYAGRFGFGLAPVVDRQKWCLLSHDGSMMEMPGYEELSTPNRFGHIIAHRASGKPGFLNPGERFASGFGGEPNRFIFQPGSLQAIGPFASVDFWDGDFPFFETSMSDEEIMAEPTHQVIDGVIHPIPIDPGGTR